MRLQDFSSHGAQFVILHYFGLHAELVGWIITQPAGERIVPKR